MNPSPFGRLLPPSMPSNVLLPNLPQPWDRLLQRRLKAVRLIMRDAREQDQFRVHAGFLKLCNPRFRWTKGRDLIVARMNRQNRKPPPRRRFRWRAGDGNRGAETLRELLRKMPR